jgi:D-galactarolactone cycloisomerase
MKITRIDAFQVRWTPDEKPTQHSAFVRIHTDDGVDGIGEASPMQGGLASLGIVRHDLAPALIGKDPLDHAVLLDTLLHTCVKLGPEGALTGTLAALDIAMWDIKGKLTGLPIYKRLAAPEDRAAVYASIGGNGDRNLDDVLRVVETRMKTSRLPSRSSLRQSAHAARPRHSRRHRQRAVRKLVGDVSLAFDANNGFTTGVIRVGRAPRSLVTGGSRNRCSTIMSRRWARWRAPWTSPCRPASRPTHWRHSRT